MTSNAGGRNDRPTLPPPFGSTRQGGAPATPPAGAQPKSNPSIPLPSPAASAGPPSSPGIPLPSPAASANPPSSPGIPLPARAGRQTQQPLPGRSHSNSQPPPLGAPPPSQPIPLIPSAGGAGGPPPGRSHSPTQPPSIRSHSSTQPPSIRSHDSTRPPPLGAPPPSQSYTPVNSMPPIMAAPPMVTPPPLGPPPPSQPFTPVESMPPIMAMPPMTPLTTVPSSMPPPGAAATQLGIPAAPTGQGGGWGGQGGDPVFAQGGNPAFFGAGPGFPMPGAGPGLAGAPAGSLVTALRRAFRLRIDPSDPSAVSAAEGAALDVAAIQDPHHRAFLAWRRSLLFVLAAAFVPLTLLRLVEVLGGDSVPGAIKALQTMPVLFDGALCALMWSQLRNWTRWQQQRRVLLLGWAAAFLAPFVVFLYPIDGAITPPSGAELAGGQAAAAAMAMAVNATANIHYTLLAVLVLGPKAVALMPGVIRAAIVSKLLFPGSAAPGWLVVLGAPLYALLAYVMLVVPYQLSGSGYFVLAILGVAGAQLLLGRAGFRLARPTTHVDALSLVARARAGYLAALGAGSLFAIVALGQLHVGGLPVLNAILSLAANVLLLTLIATDLVIANMESARNVSVDAHAAIAESQQRLATFARESTPGTNVMR